VSADNVRESGNMHMWKKSASRFLGTLLVSFLLAAPALHAQEDAVYSVNILGVQKVDLPEANQFRMSAMPFVAGSNTLIEIFGTNQLKQGSTPASCDKIRIWNAASQQYVSMAQGPDGNFYYLTDSGAWDFGPGVANNYVLNDGDGFWIVSGSGASSSRELAMVGDIISEPTNEVSIVAGYQILTFPFSCEMPIHDTSLVGSGATSSSTPGGADRIRVWNAGTQTYEGYGLAPDNQWYLLTSSGAWDPGYVVSTHVFTPGEAFFYWAQTPFTWEELNPYSSVFEE
jgi:hypothetical protein